MLLSPSVLKLSSQAKLTSLYCWGGDVLTRLYIMWKTPSRQKTFIFISLTYRIWQSVLQFTVLSLKFIQQSKPRSGFKRDSNRYSQGIPRLIMTFFVLYYSKFLLRRLFFFNMQHDKMDHHCTTLIRKKPLTMDLHYCTLSFTLAKKKKRALATVKDSALLLQVWQDISLKILYPIVRPHMPIFALGNSNQVLKIKYKNL